MTTTRTTTFDTDTLQTFLARVAVPVEPPEIYPLYVGRGMFAVPCFGIVCRPDDIGPVVLAVAAAQWARENDNHGDDVIGSALPLIETMRTDSQGLDVVVYFPGWQLDGTMGP